MDQIKIFKMSLGKVFGVFNNALAKESAQLPLLVLLGQLIGISCGVLSPQMTVKIAALLGIVMMLTIKSSTWTIYTARILALGFVLGGGSTLWKFWRNPTLDLSGEHIIVGEILDIRPKQDNISVLLKVKFINVASYDKVDKVLISAKSSISNHFMIGSEITGLFRLRNPTFKKWFIDQGHFSLQYKINGISATGRLIEIHEVKNSNIGFKGLIYRVRKSIYDVLVKEMGSNGHFVAALMLGESGRLSSEVLQAARDTGVSHILCVSGLHLSIVCFIFFRMVRLLLNCFDCIALKFNVKKIAAVCAIIASVLFLLLSGIQIASTRACIMTMVAIVGIMFDRPTVGMRTLFFTASLMLTLNPEHMYHPSFQLSYLAVVAIMSHEKFVSLCRAVYCNLLKTIFAWRRVIGSAKIFNRHTDESKPENIILDEISFQPSIGGAGVLGYVYTNVSITLLVSLVTLPLVVFHFHWTANYSILANLIIVPITSMVLLPMCVLTVLLLGPGLHIYPMKLLSAAIDCTIYAMKYIQALPGSIMHVGFIPYWLLGIGVISYLLFSIAESGARYWFIGIFMLAIIALFCFPRPKLIVSEGMLITSQANKLYVYSSKFRPQTFKRIALWLGYPNYEYMGDVENKCWVFNDVIVSNRFVNCNDIDRKLINMYDGRKCTSGDINNQILNQEGYYLGF